MRRAAPRSGRRAYPGRRPVARRPIQPRFEHRHHPPPRGPQAARQAQSRRMSAKTRRWVLSEVIRPSERTLHDREGVWVGRLSTGKRIRLPMPPGFIARRPIRRRAQPPCFTYSLKSAINWRVMVRACRADGRPSICVTGITSRGRAGEETLVGHVQVVPREFISRKGSLRRPISSITTPGDPLQDAGRDGRRLHHPVAHQEDVVAVHSAT